MGAATVHRTLGCSVAASFTSAGMSSWMCRPLQPTALQGLGQYPYSWSTKGRDVVLTCRTLHLTALQGTTEIWGFKGLSVKWPKP